MQEAKEYYLLPEEGLWHLKHSGGMNSIKTFKTEAEALSFAKNMITKQKAKIRLERQDGTWQELSS